MRDVSLEDIKEYAAEDADVTLQLKEHFQPILEKVGTKKLFDEIEIPLVQVLADMEQEGVQLDVSFLQALSTEMQIEISNLEQKIFSEFLNIKVNDIQEDKFDLDRLDIEYTSIIPKKLLTTHAFKYLGCCLIATSNPEEFASTHLYSIVEKLKDKIGVKSIHKKYELYLSELTKYNENVEKIKTKFNSDDKIDEELAKIKIPTFDFVNSLEINTDAHIKSFAKYVKSYDMTMLKNSIKFESIDITGFNIDDNLKFLLYMGVGVFSKNLDSDYTNKVLEMLQDKELAYIIADESFCYGANYLISNVIVMDDIGNSHSINTILQLIGRTSRNGKSWSGKVYLDKNTSIRIKEFFINPTFSSVEGNNIRMFFEKIKSECDCEIIRKQKEKEELENKARAKEKEKELKNKNIQKEAEEKIQSNTNIKTTNLYSELFASGSEQEQTSNDIFTWKRGSGFKQSDSINNKANSFDNNKSEINNYAMSNNQSYAMSNNQSYACSASSASNQNNNMINSDSEPNLKCESNYTNEWSGIRGKNKSVSSNENSGLFVPKSFEQLKNTNISNSDSNSSSNSSSNLNTTMHNTMKFDYKEINDEKLFKRNKHSEQKTKEKSNQIESSKERINKSNSNASETNSNQNPNNGGDYSGWVRGSNRKK